mmetsp:Transcript_13889/g.58413  ORF Transcript_13889/g.58413 Transcript_13889/m.58413 type:complete len:107 (+) Transcript_13889:228-548(+)
MTADADARPSAAVMQSCAPNPEKVDATKSALTNAASSRRTRGVVCSSAATIELFAKAKALMPSTEKTFVYSMSTSGCSFAARDFPSAAMPPLNTRMSTLEKPPKKV